MFSEDELIHIEDAAFFQPCEKELKILRERLHAVSGGEQHDIINKGLCKVVSDTIDVLEKITEHLGKLENKVSKINSKQYYE